MNRFGDIITRQYITPSARFQLMLHLNLPVFPNIHDLSGLAATRGVTITAKWSDRTRPLNTTGGFQMCGHLVRNTSKTLWPLLCKVMLATKIPYVQVVDVTRNDDSNVRFR